VWLRALVWGLGCLPFSLFLIALLVGAVVLGTLAGAHALDQGKINVEAALPAGIGFVVLGIFVYPLAAGEIARRERRYVVTTSRALVVAARRLEASVELERVRAVAPHKDLFDDSPTGIEFRVADGTSAIVFGDLADPEETRKAVEAAIAARAPAPETEAGVAKRDATGGRDVERSG
jgi:hypothetical protein